MSKDSTVQFMLAHGIPLSRETWLWLEYMGTPPETTEGIIWPAAILRAERIADRKLLRAMGINP